ncbi:adenylate/guanylate cyclase domain-containing protein [Aquibium microcysteis]|uniref:adenylate/guanylate cyclase domain-containing protein n=1 Tax=Aquibium microcysteis TaxID=675281 RepID=UPI001EF2BA32|nr:adenylate/guanylate cyclase domain-containing protein [Aquibium microcysteis]
MDQTATPRSPVRGSPIRVQRRLAAILVTDVVGYSRLMHSDEALTLERLRRLRSELLDPKLAEYAGRLVKSTGDGMIAEFHSAVDAVQYAVDVQRAIKDSNDLTDTPGYLTLRIGINVGDVVVEGDDLFGDGVNVAARIEGIAQDGGICISGTVHDQVKDKLALDFEDRGLRSVKNIAEPVRTFSIRIDGREPAWPLPAAAPAETASIAVLPFDNMSGDAEQDYFSDGITEDIITDLSKISSLLVIARNSSFTYKGRAVDVKQVARELGVRHVLEGSVRRAGNRVRITAQLIDGSTGGHVWAERYDRVLEDIFAIQDEITLTIVNQLKIHLKLGEKDRLSQRYQPNIEAYDLALRGRELIFAATQDRVEEGIRLFERSIALDPNLTFPHSGLAFAHILAYVNNWTTDPQGTLDHAHRAAERALELGPDDALAHRALAVCLLWERRMEEACAVLARAVELAPGDAETHVTRGNMLVYMHQPDLAIESLEKAVRLNPRYPDMWLYFLAHAHFMKGEYELAEPLLRERIAKSPNTDVARVLLASTLGHLGEPAQAKRFWDEVFVVNPRYSLEHRSRILPYKDPSDWERVLDGLAKAGLPTR